MIKIYGKQRSRAARCLWVLEEMGLSYTQIPIDTQNGDNRTPAYLGVNPAGKVPTLDHDGFVLRESVAINAYLVTIAETSLWPADVHTQGYIHQWSSWAISELEVPLNAIFRATRRASAAGGNANPEFIADNLGQVRTTLQLLENHLVTHHFVADGRFTLGDINTYTAAMLVPMFQDLSEYPAVRDWMGRCIARPAWQRVRALP